MEFALKSEIYCFIHLHSLLRIVFVHNIYYIFAKLSLANIRPRFSNKPIVHSRHRGRCTQKFKNNHFTFLKNTELRLFNRKESQSNSPVQLSSSAVQSNCPVQLSSPVQSMFCTVPIQSQQVGGGLDLLSQDLHLEPNRMFFCGQYCDTMLQY